MTKKLALAVMAAICLASPGRCGDAGGSATLNILCSTFPIHQIVRNVADGADGVRVELLVPAALGCPHDHALTAAEMAKLENADILAVNGLGLEEFLDSRFVRPGRGPKLLDSSAGIDNLLPYAEPGGEDHEHADNDAEGDGHGHEAGETNPHLFVSPLLSARMAENIAAALGREDAANAERYAANAGRYREAMERLARDMRELGAGLVNRRIVQPHGVFDYLARDMGLEIVGTIQPHGGGLSAAGMRDLLETIARERPGALFSEPQYSDKAGLTLARETGIGLFMLDPASAGPDDAPLDHFERVMRKNLETIKAALGRE